MDLPFKIRTETNSNQFLSPAIIMTSRLIQYLPVSLWSGERELDVETKFDFGKYRLLSAIERLHGKPKNLLHEKVRHLVSCISSFWAVIAL